MPPELPPELWGIIIDSLDDSCHAWFVLRAVSKTLRTITEDNFATRIKDGCTIRYAGGDERKIMYVLSYISLAPTPPRQGMPIEP